MEMNVALGVIKGRDTGAFDPTGNVTRAEMAKMICIVLNGGTEPSLGAKATPTFKDIKGHWAEGYIEYCAALGIVSGMGDGTFNPNGNVTGTQAAKMLLVALGYDAAFEQFNGASWSVKINVAANQKSLYEDLAIDPNAALNRDNAAQMVWNALQADMVKYDYSLTTVNGQLMNIQKLEDYDYSLMEKKFKATSTNDYEAYSYVVLTSYAWDDDDDEFDYTFTPYNSSDVAQATFSCSSTNDYTALYAQHVNVVFKYKSTTAPTTSNIDKVYGVYAADSVVLYTGVAKDIEAYDDTYIKVDGTKYKVDDATLNSTNLSTVPAFAENDYKTGGDQVFMSTVKAAYTVKVIDSDGNGKVDCVVYLPFDVAKVTYVGSKSITVQPAAGSTLSITTAKFDDDTIYSGIAKDDYVQIIAAGNTANDGNQIIKMNTVSGEVNATKTGKVQIDDTWYNLSGLTAGDFSLNEKFTIYTIGSYAYYADEGAKKVEDIAYVANVDTTTINGTQAKLY